jgi:hypothetical protein
MQVCNDYFIHRRFHKLAIWLLWCESTTSNVMSYITCCVLVRCESYVLHNAKEMPQEESESIKLLTSHAHHFADVCTSPVTVDAYHLG